MMCGRALRPGFLKIALFLSFFLLVSGPLYSEYCLSDADYNELTTLISESRTELIALTLELNQIKSDLTSSQTIIDQLRTQNTEQAGQLDRLRENLIEQKRYCEEQTTVSFWRGAAIGAGVAVVGIGLFAIFAN